MQAETINELSRIRDECKSMVTKRGRVFGFAIAIAILSPIIEATLMHQNGDSNVGDTPSVGTATAS